MKNKLNILLITFDWRNIFENDFILLKQKLNRDRLCADDNDFFIMAWSDKSYFARKDNISTVHIKTRLRHLRIVQDFASIFVLPLMLWRHRFKPDVILLYDFPFVFASFLPRLFYRSQVALILSALPSGLVRTRRGSAFLKYYYQVICEFFGKYLIDKFFCISPATKKYLLDIGVKKEIVEIVPDVFSGTDVFLAAANSDSVRIKHGIGGKKVLLNVGRLEPEKNQESLIRALADICDDSLVLLILGEGSLIESLQALSVELGVQERVIFAGFIGREEIWSYYKAADVLLLNSLSEGLGLVVWEAMRCGVPVIGSRVGGIEDSIGKNEERGYFWCQKDGFEALQSLISKCVHRDETTKERVVAAKAYIEEKLSFCYTINSFFE